MKFCTLQPVLLAAALALAVTTSSALPVGGKATGVEMRSIPSSTTTALMGREADTLTERSILSKVIGTTTGVSRVAGHRREEAFDARSGEEELYTRWDNEELFERSDDELFERTLEDEVELFERTAYPQTEALAQRSFFGKIFKGIKKAVSTVGNVVKGVAGKVLGGRSVEVEGRSLEIEDELAQRSFFGKIFKGIKKAVSTVGNVVKGVAGKVLGGRSLEAEEMLDARAEEEIYARAAHVEFY
ncbi:hypothetical protein Hypma_001222 [Hypsizygus marmoreus]|uniref:Uncharacterized protein n=1 Tax=Hypsizygus marmoreus TaxID=39966 RepID=A0A369JCQ6_HYPMA|nr:hypothetical protein Hypma_001222 [Hypsizygus marmoreus]